MTASSIVVPKQSMTFDDPMPTGARVTRDCFKDKGHIAVLTSGGDSQGMNASLRSVVRMGLFVGVKVFYVREGYSGLCNGAEDGIVEAQWFDVSDIIHRGGTMIGSARCKEFREKPGRQDACYSLVSRNITNLVVIGGDGSLTGANLFRQEWPEHIAALLAAGKITADVAKKCDALNVVGMVGSIDNDFCGTDMTIGTDSALHRIIESADAISATAMSHQRAFVMEVMGRNCGYLALVAGLCAEADFIFIPENPPPENWKEKMALKLTKQREQGVRMNIIMVSEGAIDQKGRAITATEVKDILSNQLGLDARVTVLGHVQRGGETSAFDRLLGCRQGAEAVIALMTAEHDTPPYVIGIRGNRVCRINMMESVAQTQSVKAAMDAGKFEEALTLRGSSFAKNYRTYQLLAQTDPVLKGVEYKSSRLLVIHCGAPACGMNPATRTFVRYAATKGYEVIGANGSFKGLVEGKASLIHWSSVRGWNRIGGSKIGTKRHLPAQIGLSAIARRFEEFSVAGVVLVGGFEAMQAAIELDAAKEDYAEFKVPMVVVPATISNNVPGTDFTIGADTALNEIVSCCDKIKLSAQGTKRRVFVVETMGGHCGYLATVSGLAAGADAAYINEVPFNIETLMTDFTRLKNKMEARVQRGLVMRNELADPNYTTEFIRQLFTAEAHNVFEVRQQVLGYIQQGSVPSPFDRNLATKFGMKACEYILGHIDAGTHAAALVGMRGKECRLTPVVDLIPETDFERRRWKNQWFMRLRPLQDILANKDAVYTQELEWSA